MQILRFHTTKHNSSSSSSRWPHQ